MPNAATITPPTKPAAKRAALENARSLLGHVLKSAKRQLVNQMDDPTLPPLSAQMSDPATLKKMVTIAHHDSVRERISQIYLAALKRCLVTIHAETLHRLNGSSVSLVKNTAPAAADFPFNLGNFKKMFFAEMRDAGEEALQESGESRAAELGLDEDQFVTSHGVAQKFLIDRENKLKDVPQEIYDQLKSSLEEGSKAGETERQLAARVADVMGDLEAGRAQTIARTETSSAYGTASLDAINQVGMTHKVWVTADDGKVRHSHEECQAQGPIPVDEDFVNGLAFPGDPEGDADEVINCRCIIDGQNAGGEEDDE
jgi:hypothetical protein